MKSLNHSYQWIVNIYIALTATKIKKVFVKQFKPFHKNGHIYINALQ